LTSPSARPAAAGGESDIIDFERLSQSHAAETTMRQPQGGWARLILVVAVVSSLFHLYTGGYQPLAAMQQRPIHLAFIFFLTFMLYPATAKGRERGPGWTDFAVALIAAASSAYVAWQYRDIVMRGGYALPMDLWMGALFCLVVIEAARRTMGMLLVILALIFVAYLFTGPYLPGILQHGGFSVQRVIQHMYMSTEGVYGIAVGVAATYVYLFILFGAFLNKSGTTKLFANLALAMAGHTPGGPAKVGIIASGLMGTIQGSSAANVAATGMFTIPLMKSIGFRPYFAAAVEAVASCGGQFLPPVMGASVFIMAEYLGMPYATIAASAVLPALLYYAAVYYQVHLRAKKDGLVGIPSNRLPALKSVLLDYGHLFLPIVVLVTMLIMQFTALFAAFFSIISVLVISSLRKHTRMSLWDIIGALELGAKNTISTSIACAAVGFVVGSTALSGLGLLFTHAIVGIAQGMLLPTLLLAALASLFLSMGLPTTSVYIISATLVAPALVEVGTSPLIAHLFCYYWGGVSAITPPVALAAYVGAGIAGANIMRTGFTAMRLGIAAYLVPFYFVYWPALVHWSEAPLLDVLLAIGGGVVAIFCIAGLGEQYLLRRLPWYKSGLMALGVLLILHPNDFSHALAVLLAGYVLLTEILHQRGARRLAGG